MENVFELKDKALATLRGKWGSFVGLTFVYFLISYVVEAILQAGSKMIDSPFTSLGVILIIISLILSIFVIIPISYGYNIAFLNSSRMDISAEISDLFSGFKDFGRVFRTLFLSQIIILAGAMLFLIPGIILAICYSMVPFILKDNPNLSAKEALKASRTMMDGHKWDFFLLELSFIGWALLAILTLFIGFLFLTPYVSMTNFKFYEALKQENTPFYIVNDYEIA